MSESAPTRDWRSMRAHTGSCVCGAVRFEVEVDLSAGVTRCNCTFCTKLHASGVTVKPDAFRLVQGGDALTRYAHTPGAPERAFCKRCGTHLFGDGDIPQLGGAFVSINVQTLDGVELSEIPLAYWDGRHDNWMAGTRPAPWPIYARTPDA